LKFLLVLAVNVWPKHLARRFAKELPITLGAMGVLELEGLEGVVDLRGKQIPVLEADIGRRPLEVNVRPALLLEAVSLL